MILRLSTTAKSDLQNISRYTRKEWGIEQEALYLNQRYNRFEDILHDPSRWRFRNTLHSGFQSARVGKHIVFFKVDAKIILVARILH